jgi:general secretion pathway protein F
MSGYKFEALDPTGRLRKGVLEADNERQARQALREQNMVALQVQALLEDTSSPTHKKASAWRRGLSSAQLSLLTRQLANLIGAGLTIEETLNALIDQAENERSRQILAAIRSQVLSGQPLSKAMEAHPQVFPAVYLALVSAGEDSGQLNQVLQRLADYIEERHALRQKILLAFIYPVVVTLVAILVVGGLLTYVVPQVVAVFRDSHQTLPWLTRALIGLSDFLRATGVFWLAGLFVAAWAARRALHNPALKFRFHQFLLRVPTLGRFVRDANAARLASTLAILANSGVPLLVALQAGANVVLNLPLRRAVEDAARMVREGASLSKSLGRGKLFPPAMIHLIASGEASGKLGQMLDQSARQQSQMMGQRLAVLTGLLEPLLILAMGGVVLIIVLAILLPIFEMNQLIK